MRRTIVNGCSAQVGWKAWTGEEVSKSIRRRSARPPQVCVSGSLDSTECEIYISHSVSGLTKQIRTPHQALKLFDISLAKKMSAAYEDTNFFQFFLAVTPLTNPRSFK